MIREINAKFVRIVTIAGLKIIRLCQQTKANWSGKYASVYFGLDLSVGQVGIVRKDFRTK